MQKNICNLAAVLLLTTTSLTAHAETLTFPSTTAEWVKALSVPAKTDRQGSIKKNRSIKKRNIVLLSDKPTPIGAKTGADAETTGSTSPTAIVAGADDRTVTVSSSPRAGAIVQFEVNSSRIHPSANTALDYLGQSLVGPLADAVLMIEGHTDSDGKPWQNIKLSGRRAEAVRKYLIRRHGVSPSRLQAKAYGSNRPIADNKSAAGRGKNRRVEFVRIN